MRQINELSEINEKMTAESDENEYKQCILCTRLFRTLEEVKDHIICKVVCPICDKVVPGYDGLKKHAVVHNKAKYLPCNSCGKYLVSKQSLNNHINKKHLFI